MVRCSWKKNAGGSMPENKTQQELATMCRAMEQMRDETAAEQNIKTLLVSVKNLMKNMNLSPEQAMNAMGISEADRQALLQLL